MGRNRAIVAAAFAVGMTACGQASQTGTTFGAEVVQTVAPVSETPDATLAASTAEWRDFGLSVLKDKAEMAGRGGYDSVANEAAYAFQSEPIDVRGPGEYQLVFHDVDVQIEAFVLAQPPDAPQRFTGQVSNREQSESTLILTFVVDEDGYVADYAGFTAWVY